MCAKCAPELPQGKFWLLAGFANPDSVLYGDELGAVQAANPETMRLDVALSGTQTNKRGEPQYVQVWQSWELESWSEGNSLSQMQFLLPVVEALQTLCSTVLQWGTWEGGREGAASSCIPKGEGAGESKAPLLVPPLRCKLLLLEDIRGRSA